MPTMCASKDQANGEAPEQSRVDPEIDQEWEARRARFHNVIFSWLHCQSYLTPMHSLPCSYEQPHHQVLCMSRLGTKRAWKKAKPKPCSRDLMKVRDRPFASLLRMSSDIRRVCHVPQAHGHPRTLYPVESHIMQRPHFLKPVGISGYAFIQQVSEQAHRGGIRKASAGALKSRERPWHS